MQLPICIDGETVGAVQLSRRGGCIHAEARLKDMGRVLRLFIFGEGEVYLGIPEPREDGMYLSRCLQSLPREPRYCAERRQEEKTEAAPAESPEDKGPRRVLWQGGKAHYF